MSFPAISRTASVNSTATDTPSVAPSSNALLGQATRQVQHGRFPGLKKVGSKLRQIGPALSKVGSKLGEVGLALNEANADCMAGCPPDLPDFFGPFQSWRTASIASVEQYRCLNSLGVR